MKNMDRVRHAVPVIAFAVCVFAGWITTFVLDQWFLLCVGLLTGIVAGDFTAALVRPPEPPPHKPLGKPR